MNSLIYNNIISLGSNCAPAKAIREYFKIERAFPFDWWISGIDQLLYVILKDFDKMFEPDEMHIVAGSVPTVCSSRYGIAYHHDFARTEHDEIVTDILSQLSNVKEKYDFLFNRMDLVVRNSRTLFIRYGFDDDRLGISEAATKILKLKTLLESRWPDAEIKLLALATTELPTDFT